MLNVHSVHVDVRKHLVVFWAALRAQNLHDPKTRTKTRLLSLFWDFVLRVSVPSGLSGSVVSPPWLSGSVVLAPFS